MPELTIPMPTEPLTQDVSDMDVIDGVEEEEELLYETEEALILLNIIQEYDRAEEFVRLTLVRKWRRQIHYWNNYQYLAWDEVAHDWMTPEEVLDQDPQADIDPALYAKVINVYKAHGEILIGALTAGTPIVRFMPKDADDHEDVTSAKAYSKLAELVQKHNHARLLLMRSLFILYNQAFVAAYNENKADYRFGAIKVPDYADVEVTDRQNYCPGCGYEFGLDRFEPDPTDPYGPVMPEQECPGCGEMVSPEFEDTPGVEKRQVGVHDEPKNRETIEVYGPLNVKVPVWCRDQFSTPYLILETEEPVALMREIYPELADKIQATSYPDIYDKEARIPTHYRYDFPKDLCTVQRVWLRRWALNLYQKDVDKVVELKEKYPEGCYIVVINESLVAEVVKDKLDDHWTISENPLSEVLHSESLGAPMVPLQDITNELANLTLETIEFGIPELFADPRVIDFESYQRTEARPGQVSPASAPAGQTLSGGFHEIKAASLSREVELFADRIFSVSQFVMGSYPSIYGGAQEGGSGTAKEYEMSKASALQRLSTTWSILQEWWSKVITKGVRSFVSNMREDEKFVQPRGSNFVNVWIRKAELSGEVGDVDPEITETFPISWTQKRDVLLNLIQMGNEDIAAVIRHPENAGLVAQIIGVPELYIPGDDDRNKQLYEIGRLIREEPQEIPAPFGPDGIPLGPPQVISSVPVDPDVDAHPVEAEVCRAWLKSEVGLDAKENNPAGYANVLAHLREHLMFAQPPPLSPDEEMTEEGVAI